MATVKRSKYQTELTAFHEAGHAVALCARPRIWLSDDMTSPSQTPLQPQGRLTEVCSAYNNCSLNIAAGRNDWPTNQAGSGIVELKMRMTPQRILAEDLARQRRNAAMHEAGHVVMAERFGVRVGMAYIFCTEPYDPMKLSWAGETWYCRGGRWRFDDLSVHKRAMISVAGAAAELIWDCEFADPCELVNLMSPPDWEGSGLCR